MTATPVTGPAPLAVTFDGRGSTDPEGQALTHSWVFGDGQNRTGATIVHTYGAAGTYTATLRVVNPGGAEAFDSMNIIVSTPGPAPIPAPTNLQATAVSRTVNLSWTDNAASETETVSSVPSEATAHSVKSRGCRRTREPSAIPGWREGSVLGSERPIRPPARSRRTPTWPRCA